MGPYGPFAGVLLRLLLFRPSNFQYLNFFGNPIGCESDAIPFYLKRLRSLLIVVRVCVLLYYLVRLATPCVCGVSQGPKLGVTIIDSFYVLKEIM